MLSTDLFELEQESIFYIREALLNAKNPGVLFTAGKDSSVLAHLIKKSFPLQQLELTYLTIDTGWKFKQMKQQLDVSKEIYQINIKTYINESAVKQNINPFEHGSEKHTHEYKTLGLRQALAEEKFDFVLAGGRRDEERSRSKERIFSLRDQNQSWLPGYQRPEPWASYNLNFQPGQSMRVFPLSNWTELSIWRYIQEEDIPVSSLYFAQERPIVYIEGQIILVDDDRILKYINANVEVKKVRLRTLGCYPLSAAIMSEASSVEQIIDELRATKNSERAGRIIDSDRKHSMEYKKRIGYF